MHLRTAEAAILRGLLAAHLPGGVQVWVFGSRVHGRGLKPFSDLDLCLRGPGGADAAPGFSAACAASNLPFRVDVVVWEDLGPSFQAQITADLRLIWPEPETA